MIDRLPSNFIDPLRAFLQDRIQSEGKIQNINSEKFLETTDEAARGRALEARGRKLAYSEILNKLMGDKDGR